MGAVQGHEHEDDFCLLWMGGTRPHKESEANSVRAGQTGTPGFQGNPASPFTALPPCVMTWRTPPALKSADWLRNSAGPRMQPSQPLLKARKFTNGPSVTSQCGAALGPRAPISVSTATSLFSMAWLKPPTTWIALCAPGMMPSI